MPQAELLETTAGARADERALGNVLVTGGSSGLGRAIVDAVAAAGGTPLVLDLQDPGIDGVAFEQVDLSDPRAAEQAVGRIAGAAGGLDAAVTAAGIDACGQLTQVDAEAWDRVVLVNLLGTAAVARAALPHLEKVHGKLVTVASTLGFSAVSDASAYCASKFGVVGLTRALQAELGGRVGVTLLVPGGMHTHFFDDRPEQYKPGPDAVLNQPTDVAHAVLGALRMPPGCEIKEMVVAHATEGSWPP